MNRLLGLCVLVSTAVGVVVNRREIAEAWRSVVDMLPYPAPPRAPVIQIQLDGKLLREVMDITRP